MADGNEVDPRVLNVDVHSATDFARDTASAVVGGIILMAIGGGIAMFRHFRERLSRHGHEIRHTQEKTDVKPFYPEYPADKL